MEKVCTQCKRSLPMDINFFHRLNTSKDGFNTRCKECRGSKFGIIMPNKVLNIPKGKKYCNTCKVVKPIENFPLYSKGSDGYASKCKDCKNKQAKEKYDPEKEKERTKPVLEKRYAQKKIYYKNNREKLAKQKKEYRKTDRWKKLKRFSNEKRRTNKLKLESNFTKQQWKNCIKHFNNSCCYCGNKVEIFSMDHFIPLSKGGEWTVNNIVPACMSCNSSKRANDFFKWYPKQEFYSKQREQKILKYLNYDNNHMQQLALL